MCIGKIINSGSDGNCIIYHKTIAVDMGIPFSKIKPYLYDLQLIALTHIHSDHFNLSTIKRIAFERPGLRFLCGKWLVPYLDGIKNIDVCEIGIIYDYGIFKISAVKAYHDVENIGFRIFKDTHKLFHITDTCTLEGISAKNYNSYFIEVNYNDETIWETIKSYEEQGKYAYMRGAINSHLSKSQAQDFVIKNAGDNYEFVMLHQSKTS